MKVFISWSGSESRQVALALRRWLRVVIQSIKPYMSERDIASGARWLESVADELDASSFGILCVTPSNLAEPWLQFEAGALSKSVTDKAHVVPLLFRMEPADLPAKNPLSAFQAVRADRNGVRKLLGDVNALCGEGALEESVLDESFATFWPRLEEQLGAVHDTGDADALPERSEREMLAEILEIVREQQTAFSVTGRNVVITPLEDPWRNYVYGRDRLWPRHHHDYWVVSTRGQESLLLTDPPADGDEASGGPDEADGDGDGDD